MAQYVYGKNVVKQLLKDKKKIYELLIAEGMRDTELEDMIRKARIDVKRVPKKKLDSQFRNENHQGVVASIDDYKVYELDELLNSIPEGKTPLIILADGLEDPHNLGAILRTSDAVGVDGVIIGKHRCASLTPTVAKVSTGAIDTVKVAQVTNLVQAIEKLKKAGFWVVGTDLEKSTDYTQGTYDVPLCVVIGNEGTGISKLVKKNCDYCVRLPMVGQVQSLNASVACGILLYEVFNQRRVK